MKREPGRLEKSDSAFPLEITFQLFFLASIIAAALVLAPGCALAAIDPETALNMARNFARRNMIGDAQNYYSAIWEQAPETEQAPTAMFESIALSLSVAEKKLNEESMAAVQKYLDLLSRYPTSKEAARGLLNAAELLLKLKNDEKAMDILENCANSFPDTEEGLEATVRLAELKRSKNDFSGAIATWDKVLRDYPTSSKVVDAYLKIAEIYAYDLKDEYTAERYYVEAAENLHESGGEKVLLWIARHQMKIGASDKAISTYKKIVDNYPASQESRTASLECAEILEREKRYAEAVEMYEAFVKNFSFEKEKPRILYRIALILDVDMKEYHKTRINDISYYKLKRASLERAFQAYRRVINEAPDSAYAPKALLRAAVIAKENLFDADTARQMLQTLVEKYSDTPEALQAKNLIAERR